MKKLQKELREWCGDPKTDSREESRKVIRQQLSSNHPRAAVVAGRRLISLAGWHGNHGVLAVLEGRTEGWVCLDRALQYSWYGVRIDIGMAMASKAALILAHAMAFEQETMADWLAERLIRSVDDGTVSCWHSATFGAFILKLWAMHRGRPDANVVRPNVASLGVYQRVLDTWSKPDELHSALGEACDYHLSQSWTARGYPDFVHSPYQLFPVDMLAIAKVRGDLGLEMPKVEHPLLATPLAALPARDDRPKMGPDPLLEQVIQKAKDTGFL